jgi:hypothetical protein
MGEDVTEDVVGVNRAGYGSEMVKSLSDIYGY